MALQGIKTAGEWLSRGEEQLRRSRVPEPAANAELLLAHVLGMSRPAIKAFPSRILTEKERHHFWHLVLERAKRTPLAYVLGFQPFMGLDIEVSPSVLVPRPETEQLVEAVLDAVEKEGKRPLNILEIGTGSGCISVALASRLPQAVLYATDISQAALRLAEKNARKHRVEGRIRFLREDIFKPDARVGSPWADVLVTNPPYVPTEKLRRLEPEVLQEPFLALDGGKDGLHAIRAIISGAPRLVKAGGWLALEIGEDQAREVVGLIRSLSAQGCSFPETQVRKDLQSKDRVVMARRARAVRDAPKCIE
ncbi:MAG: peptide chain release factor N(5)-glutamine methyltransferase [Elusimicrobia bacterium]|nr:peptide chain release factor N(5)-glutamine methyltransferase [Elusimicrobiota bacterium]